MNREPIYVVGYPKSGNTWLSRLLGEALDSPVDRYKEALPIACEGLNRPGPYVIYQLHLKPDYSHDYKQAVPNAYKLNIPSYNHEKIVFIVRDPRDVVVSVQHYWHIKTLKEALKDVGEGLHPIKIHGSWQDYVASWLRCPVVNEIVRYEDLHENPVRTLKIIITNLGITINSDDIKKAVENQEFHKKRHTMAVDGEKRPYGKAIQLHNMRKGIVGDWKNHFTRHDAKEAANYFGEVMQWLKYEEDDSWVKEVAI